MNRDCIFRFYQRIDQLDFFLAGMSGNMDILENNLRTLHGKLIDNPVSYTHLDVYKRQPVFGDALDLQRFAEIGRK